MIWAVCIHVCTSTQSIIKCVVIAIAAATVFEHITAKYDGDGDSVYLPYNVHTFNHDSVSPASYVSFYPIPFFFSWVRICSGSDMSIWLASDS